VFDAKNQIHESQSQVVGSQLSAKEMNLNAGNNLNIQGSYLNTEDKMQLSAGNNIHIQSAEQEKSFEQSTYRKSKGFLSSKTQRGLVQEHTTQQVGSMLSAGSISMQSGGNTEIQASQLVRQTKI
jgi:filamentous hemagglutinin